MNKKLIVGLTVLATPFVVENIVEVNVASANQTASARTQATQQVAKSSEYVLNKPAKAYLTANDAAQRVNQKATYQAGSYHVYNQSKGMVNISKASGKAGSWINPVDSPNAKRATTGSVVTSATSPVKETNQVTRPTTTTKHTSQTTTSVSAPVKGTNLSLTPPKSGQYSLLKPTEAYVNAVDASKRVNARGKVSAGNYYIFREYKGMVNISRAQGKVGSWINPELVAAPITSVTETKPTAPATNTTPVPEKIALTQTVGTKTSTGLFTLPNATEAYINAIDASRKVNVRGRVAAGNYHIFREYKGMLNISRVHGRAGAWINPGVVPARTVTTKTEQVKPRQTETKQTPSTQTVENKTNTGLFTLANATEAYVNASDASKKVNARGMLAAGNYYIFREYKGMLNISRTQGKVGSWINPTVKETVTTPTQMINNVKATPQNVKSPTYINGILLVNKKHPLPQNYNPGENKEAKTNFDNLRAALRKAGHGVSNSYSGFRSYNHQANLYRNYVARNGQATADTFSARPGYSEHQTGLAFDLIDLNGQVLGGQGTTSASRKAADWVAKNAHNYGFIVRYKENIKDITGYMSEPWHLRYVGKTVASEIFRKNIALETYLGAPGGDYIK